MSLHDTYDVAEPLGEGGMCTVRRAWHRRLERPVALKFLRPELAADPTERARFLREAEVGRRLDHPGIVRALDLGETDEGPWLALELVDGDTLAGHLALGLAREDACGLLAQVARALAHAHDMGVIHRDLKPSNVLVGADGRARVADWGLARGLVEEAGLTKTGIVLGTPEYMAPEQIRGATPGPAVDTYSLGVMIFEVVGGRRPFLGTMTDVLLGHLRGSPPSLRHLAPGLPPPLASLVGRLLDKDPTRRPSAAEAAVILEACAAGHEPASSAPAPLRPSRVRHGVVVLGVLAGAAALLFRMAPLDHPSDRLTASADLSVVDRVVAEAPDRVVVRHRTRSPLRASLDLVEHTERGDVTHPRLVVTLAPASGPPGTAGGTVVDLPSPLLDSSTATLTLSGSAPRTFGVDPTSARATLLAPLGNITSDQLLDLLEGLDELRRRFPTTADASAFSSGRDDLLTRAGLDQAWMSLARRVLPALARATIPHAPPRPLLVEALAPLEALESASPGKGEDVPPWGVAVSSLRGVRTRRNVTQSPAGGWYRKSLAIDVPDAKGGAPLAHDTQVQLLPADLVTKIALSDVGAAFRDIHSVQYPGPYPGLSHGLGALNLVERREAVRAVYEFRVVNWNSHFALEVAVDGGERRELTNTWGRFPHRPGSFPEEPHLVQIALDPAPLRRGPVSIRLRLMGRRRSLPANPPRVSHPRLLVALPGAASEPWSLGP